MTIIDDHPPPVEEGAGPRAGRRPRSGDRPEPVGPPVVPGGSAFGPVPAPPPSASPAPVAVEVKPKAAKKGSGRRAVAAAPTLVTGSASVFGAIPIVLQATTPTQLLCGAAAAGGVGAAAVARKVGKRRSSRGRDTGSGAATPGLRTGGRSGRAGMSRGGVRGGGPTRGGSLGGAGRPVGRLGAALGRMRPGSGAATPGSRTAGTSRGSTAVGRLARRLAGSGPGRAAATTGRRVAASPVGRAGRHAARKAAGVGRRATAPLRTALGSAAHGLRKGATAPAAARAAWKAARKTAHLQGRRRPWLRGMGAGALALGAGLARSAWRRTLGKKVGRRFADERELWDDQYGHGRPAQARRQPVRAGTRPAVENPPARPTSGPARLVPTTPSGTVGPQVPTTRPERPPARPHPVTTLPQGDAMHPMQRLTAEILSVSAARARGRTGMLEVVADSKEWGPALSNITQAILAEARALDDSPVADSIRRTVYEAVKHVNTAAKVLGDAAGAIETVHKDKLDDLRNPARVGPNPQMWDQTMNRGHA